MANYIRLTTYEVRKSKLWDRDKETVAEFTFI